jgi:hypothetical protein
MDEKIKQKYYHLLLPLNLTYSPLLYIFLLNLKFERAELLFLIL